LLLTHGPAPYYLVAGSMKAARDQYPLDILITQVKQTKGQDWKPTEVALGQAGKVISDMEAVGRTPTDWKNIILWTVLLLGAGGVILMVLKLLSQPEKK
jgi:hypothetical protein